MILKILLYKDLEIQIHDMPYNSDWYTLVLLYSNGRTIRLPVKNTTYDELYVYCRDNLDNIYNDSK